MANYSDYTAAVEVMSGGTNKTIFDDIGLPSIMVAFPKLKYSDVFTDSLATDETLPAFIVGEVEKDIVWVSKYQNIVINDRAYSLPNKPPKTRINLDSSTRVCRQKGAGWALIPNSVWAAIALWSRKNATMPHGNNNYGCDSNAQWEKGITATKETTPPYHIRLTHTGTGTESWNHNGDASGITDLVGNAGEFVSGLMLNCGEINIIPNGDAMMPNADLSVKSPLWRAVLGDGTLSLPNEEGTVKYGWNGTINLDTVGSVMTDGTRISDFSTITADLSVTDAFPILTALGLYPEDATIQGRLGINNYSDRNATRGGSYAHGTNAGIFTLFANIPTTQYNSSTGFRSVYTN